jgi:uncharacterized protein YciI
MEMKSYWVVCVVLTLTLTVVGCLLVQAQAENPLAPYIPKNTKPYYIDLLMRKGSPVAEMPEAERAEWMQKHLSYIRSQVEAGKFVLVGPVTEDASLRGIAIIKADSREEAQRIAAGDPLVKAGKLEVELHPIMLEDLSGVHIDYPSSK